ncbi:hypothetical protein [Leeuwenhoekiella aestuarii]
MINHSAHAICENSVSVCTILTISFFRNIVNDELF